MNDRIPELLAQIKVLEEELQTTVHAQEHRMFFQIQGKRVEFEQTIRQTHRRLKQGFFRWLVTNRPQNLITGPIIYSMIFPMLVLDVCVIFTRRRARKVLGTHARYAHFLDYGDAADHAARVEEFRCALEEIKP